MEATEGTKITDPINEATKLTEANEGVRGGIPHPEARPAGDPAAHSSFAFANFVASFIKSVTSVPSVASTAPEQ